MSRLVFWLGWSLRDLRERWLLVGAIALTIALGTGGFAGMSSTTEWRTVAIEASADQLAMHDVRLELAEGAAVPVGALRALAADLADRGVIVAMAERLIVPVAVDASVGDRTILVPGTLIGVELADGGPAVDRVDPDAGRALTARDDGADVVLLEYRFARFYDLAPEGRVVVAGRPMRYVGQASTPEMFVVMAESGAMMAEASLAGVFAGLSTVQELASMPGLVNDLVVRVGPGEDPAAVGSDLARAAADALPGIGSRMVTRDQDPSYMVIVGDIETDGEFFAIFALLILLGAAFATFNLTSRVVEAQRREIGIGMALGAPGRWLALRPLLMGIEIATLGVVLGIGVGMLFNEAMLSMLRRLMPLPVFEAPLLAGPFLAAAVVGFVVPFAATLIPVRRAIRMSPVEAIHAGPRAVRGSGLAGLASWLPLPGGTVGRAPLRNLLRAPRRSLLTALGIGGAVSVLVAMSAMIDTFEAAIGAAERETLGGHPDRVTVELAGFLPSATVTAALADEAPVGSVSVGLRVGATVEAHGETIDLVLALVDLRAPGWQPSVVAGAMPDGSDPGAGGLLLAEEAARDLAIGVGDEILLRHPRRTGATTVDLVESPMTVVGLHPSPNRAIAYLDLADADLLGLAGMVNSATIEPAPGADQEDVIRAVFGQPGVVSALPVATVTDAYRDLMDEFVAVLLVAEGLAVLLALLVAFNSASIGADERAREHATMLAFGLPVRSLLGIEVVENVLLGLTGTAVGLVVGIAAVAWVVGAKMADMLPDVAVPLVVAPVTVAAAGIVGVVVVGLAPLLMVRRLRRMDLPGTLRLVE
jgi:putative ABC transport system permease protein